MLIILSINSIIKTPSSSLLSINIPEMMPNINLFPCNNNLLLRKKNSIFVLRQWIFNNSVINQLTRNPFQCLLPSFKALRPRTSFNPCLVLPLPQCPSPKKQSVLQSNLKPNRNAPSKNTTVWNTSVKTLKSSKMLSTITSPKI